MEILELEIAKPNSHILQMRKRKVRTEEFTQSATVLRPEP